MDEYLTVAQNRHVKQGTPQRVSAGTEIHLKAWERIVIDSRMKPMMKDGAEDFSCCLRDDWYENGH
ncbi:hypothetical protein ALQ18_01177 [Pseudomonas marginalis pv. marginalis]|nr:hypothetical protein ALQ18_01177 [Pseudomonas marginalis pv. marginalis]